MPWTAGERLQGGKYVIEKELGSGGFGITYKALHVELNQTVVIKTPIDTLSRDPEYEKYIERFIKEGQILARLSEHLNSQIVGVIDLFKEGSTHCLVMDFVPGENLFQAVRRRGALPEAEIVPCIRQIGEALMVVHQAGLVHRDAHPGNIMLPSNGKAVLIDFGIAKELVPKTLTSKGYAGNPGFAPYEQRHRGSREPTVDVYCLAATLYYAVTGQSPTPSLARKLDNVSLTPPKQIIPGLSDPLNQAILKGMALEAEDRPQSMQLWLAMLKASKATPPPTVDTVYRQEVVPSKAKPKATLDKPTTKSSDRPQSIRLAMLEGQKVTPTPPVNPVHKQEVVPSKPKLNSKTIPGQPKRATKSPKIIPWGWLVAVLLSYLLIGFCLTMRNASSWVLIIAVAVAVAVAITVYQGKAMAKAINDAVAQLTGIVALAIIGVTFGFLPVVLVVAVVVMLALPMIMAVVLSIYSGAFVVYKCGDELQKSFSKFHTFLILASNSSLGLGLGWLGYILQHKPPGN
jgi:serine/threonine protein kinase